MASTEMPETENQDIPDALDFSSLIPEDVPAPDSGDFGVPDFKASKSEDSTIAKLFSTKRGRKPNSEKTETPRKRAASKPSIPRRKGMFVQPLTQLYTGIGTMMMMVDPVCANAIIVSAEQCAETLDELAYNNDAVRRALWSLTQTSATTAVIIAHMPIMLAVATHHVPAVRKMLPGAMVPTVDPEFKWPPESEQAPNE